MLHKIRDYKTNFTDGNKGKEEVEKKIIHSDAKTSYRIKY